MNPRKECQVKGEVGREEGGEAKDGYQRLGCLGRKSRRRKEGKQDVASGNRHT